MSDFVSLTCPSCGGKLQIGNDIERFACGYCGNENVVKRGGGIVSLAPVIDEIKKVQVGVDKTASELAIRRLKDEIKTIKNSDDKIRRILARYDVRYKDNFHHVLIMQDGIRQLLETFDNKKPSKVRKIWSIFRDEQNGNISGFSNDDYQDKLYSVTQAEIVELKHFFEKDFIGITYEGSLDKFTGDMHDFGVIKLRDDLENILDLFEVKKTLPAKESELLKHQQIVNNSL